MPEPVVEPEKEVTPPAPTTPAGLSQEQANELVEKARREEKDKLYPQLEELKRTTKEVQDALRAEQEEKAKIKAEAEKKAEEERRSKLSSEQILQEGLRKIEEQLASERQARAELETRLEEEKRVDRLAAYRIQKIQEAGGEILPELVRGNSEAEIDASVTIAKARYTEIVESVKAERAAEVRRQMPGPASPDTAAAEERELAENIEELDIDVSRYMKDKAYKAEIDIKKAEIQAKAARVYERSVGR